MLDHFILMVEKNTLNQSLVCTHCQLVHILLGLNLFRTPIDENSMESEAGVFFRSFFLHFQSLTIVSDALVVRKVAKLVEILGTHSVSVRELKRLFGLFKSEPGDFRPASANILLPALQNMTLKRSNSQGVFHLLS
jgi:hypothetical protein